ncbi:MAG TPA: dienelactone hydrolase family protein [Gaiella sp.]|nr:dienelactone hydrolase family protein [Gaiella sp.]
MPRAAVVLGLLAATLAAGCGKTDGGAEGPLAYDHRSPLAIERGARSEGEGTVVQELSYASGDDRVEGYLVAPSATDARVPAVVFLHGAGGDRSEQLESARKLAARGAVALTITAPSRRKAPSPGATPEALVRWQGDVVAADVIAARRGLDLLAADERVDADRLGIVGWSAGGRLATLVSAVDERVRATVLMSVGALPVAEYVDAAPAELRDVVREVLEPIDPLSRLGDAQGAVLVQAGRRDSLVPRRALEAVIAASPEDRRFAWYLAGHELNARAQTDRLDWLAEQLGIGGAGS